MKLAETSLAGVWLVQPDVHHDERGSFSTHFEERWFRERSLQSSFNQECLSANPRAGTLRGLHWQEPPDGQVKLVRCVRGAIFDVVVDLRQDSPTFRRWFSVELSPEAGYTLYVPVGCAHGYQTLRDDSWVTYQISGHHSPGCARGIRWNDPAFGINWPSCVARLVSTRDASYADYGDHG